MTADHLTKPERSCARAQTKRVRALVLEEGGCCYCVHRARVFQGVGRLAACGLDPPRAFPACVAFRGGFQFDEAAFLEGAGKTMNVTKEAVDEQR